LEARRCCQDQANPPRLMQSEVATCNLQVRKWVVLHVTLTRATAVKNSVCRFSPLTQAFCIPSASFRRPASSRQPPVRRHTSLQLFLTQSADSCRAEHYTRTVALVDITSDLRLPVLWPEVSSTWRHSLLFASTSNSNHVSRIDHCVI
jgi:hypothetical protein